MAASKLFLLALCAAFSNAQNSFRLANIYQNEMVLQMEPKNAQIWGFGEPDARIVVNYDNTQILTSVKADGTWVVSLRPHAAGGPIDFEINHTIYDMTFTIILSAWFGDVWVCSGQSNMEMSVNLETTTALSYTNIRLLHVKNDFNADTEFSEVSDFAHGWSAPSADNVPSFSALCLFYGERMSESFNNTRPIGLIDSTWGGTRIEAWMSPRVAEYCLTPPDDQILINAEFALWNAMIAPLTKTAIRGAIWYQGENNVGSLNADYYSCHIAAMAQDWKNTFVDGDVEDENGIAFPFGVVQIGPANRGEAYNWGDLRLHQTVDQGVLPNPLMPEAFFATAYDLTDHDSPTGEIHPRDKQTVADRLSNAAKNLLYGENFRANGPIPISAIEDAPGQVTITYDTNIRIGGTSGFAVQMSDGTWSPVSIVSSTTNSVTVGVDADAAILTLGYRATVCEYKQCPVYSDDAENLPAQVWRWDLSAIRRQ